MLMITTATNMAKLTPMMIYNISIDSATNKQTKHDKFPVSVVYISSYIGTYLILFTFAE